MKFSPKTIALLGIITLSTVAVIATTTVDRMALSSYAQPCEHSGNHYTAKNATNSASGIKEYWVCCHCHEHFFVKPNNLTWVDSGKANITIDKNDNRYIPATGTYGGYDAMGFKYSADGKTITAYKAPTGQTEVVIPEGIVDIGTAFKGSNITKITIPSSIPTIDGQAFEGCSSLKNVIITPGVEEMQSSGSYPGMHGAFRDCSKLEWITIPSTVTEMDAYEFTGVNSNCVFYCEAPSKPSGWSDYWAYNQQIFGSQYKNIVWGVNINWYYGADGVPHKY